MWYQRRRVERLSKATRPALGWWQKNERQDGKYCYPQTLIVKAGEMKPAGYATKT
jgi:hypothetical protein